MFMQIFQNVQYLKNNLHLYILDVQLCRSTEIDDQNMLEQILS